jgi:hypothetical protein
MQAEGKPVNDMIKYVERFFDELEVFEDLECGHCYKIFIRQAILEFIDMKKDTALAVYRTFISTATELPSKRIHPI